MSMDYEVRVACDMFDMKDPEDAAGAMRDWLANGGAAGAVYDVRAHDSDEWVTVDLGCD